LKRCSDRWESLSARLCALVLATSLSLLASTGVDLSRQVPAVVAIGCVSISAWLVLGALMFYLFRALETMRAATLALLSELRRRRESLFNVLLSTWLVYFAVTCASTAADYALGQARWTAAAELVRATLTMAVGLRFAYVVSQVVTQLEAHASDRTKALASTVSLPELDCGLAAARLRSLRAGVLLYAFVYAALAVRLFLLEWGAGRQLRLNLHARALRWMALCVLASALVAANRSATAAQRASPPASGPSTRRSSVQSAQSTERDRSAASSPTALMRSLRDPLAQPSSSSPPPSAGPLIAIDLEQDPRPCATSV
jgi:hypothetical protein